MIPRGRKAGRDRRANASRGCRRTIFCRRFRFGIRRCDVACRLRWTVCGCDLGGLAGWSALMGKCKVAAPVIFTSGYEGRVQDELLDRLVAAGARVLLDIRAGPMSRKPGFSKQILGSSAEARG